jgi:membrane protease YdiL (CAAX protease family)
VEKVKPRLPARGALWGLAGLFAGALFSLVLAVAVYLPTGRLALATLAGEIGLWTAFAGTCLLVSRRYGTGRLAEDFGLAFRGVDVALGVAVFAVCVTVSGLVGSLFAHSRLRGTNTKIITSVRHDAAGFIVVAAIATVGAPIFEELFFRGLMLRSLEGRFGASGAVWLQAVVFSLGHLQPGVGLGIVSVIAATFALGVVLGYSARLTGRLGPGMVAHALFNGVVTLAIALAR